MNGPALRCSVGEPDGLLVRIVVAGEIDLATAGILAGTLERVVATVPAGGRVVLDMTAVAFVAAVGVRVIGLAADRAAERSAELVVLPPVSRAFETVLLACGRANLLATPRP